MRSPLNFPWKFIWFFTSFLMLLVSIYMTVQYMEVRYPQTLDAGWSCDWSEKLSCQSTFLSNASHFWGLRLPLPWLGVALSSYLIFSELLKFNRFFLVFLAFLNFSSSMFFLFYSFWFVDVFCPFCLIYDFLSCILVLLSWNIVKQKETRKSFCLKDLLFFLIFLTLIQICFLEISKNRQENYQHQTKIFISSFEKQKDYSKVLKDIKKKIIHSAQVEPHVDLVCISDFQCPSCQFVALKQIPKLKKHYKEKIHISFLPFPLDHSCNNLSPTVHPLACKASLLSLCSKERDFINIHNSLFSSQRFLTSKWLDDKAHSLGLTSCYNSTVSHQNLKDLISRIHMLGVRQTPTLFINGRRLDYPMPLRYLIHLIDRVKK